MNPTKHLSGQKWLRVTSLHPLHETGRSTFHHRILATIGTRESEQAPRKARDLSLKTDGLREVTYKDFPVGAACVVVLSCVPVVVNDGGVRMLGCPS